MFGAGGLSSNYALDFAPYSIECDKLNAILATGEVRAGKTSVWGVKTDMRLCRSNAAFRQQSGCGQLMSTLPSARGMSALIYGCGFPIGTADRVEAEGLARHFGYS